jgi:hypothetical protein
MSRRRIIKSVLNNFLGTFTSRYSDFNGYWVFGFLVESIDRVSIDLLGASTWNTDTAPLAFTRRLASQRFADQITKAHFPTSWVQEARLNIAKSPVVRLGVVNGHSCSGYDVRFLAYAVTDLGKTYETALSIFVAPHNPKVERRSGRVT